MIQVLTNSRKKEAFQGPHITINNIHDARSLDDFEINVIDLNDSNIWKNNGNYTSSINDIANFDSLSTMINVSKKSFIVIILPQNLDFHYNYSDVRGFLNKRELKDMKKALISDLLARLYDPICAYQIIYENTITKIGGKNVKASFCFYDSVNVLTKSEKSERATTIKNDNVILSTLNISTYDQLMDLLRQIKLIVDKEETPKWMEDEKMFDDLKQLEIIDDKTEIIKKASEDIDKAKEILKRNSRYKSILYTSGDELVDVVFEIITQMLGCDLSGFNDVKKEDFNFEIDDKVFIGEIKGVTSNVKNANVSQLDTHVQNYIDEHEADKENIVSLLIINHQRNKPLSQREEVHKNAIELAIRNESLIIETITLLKMFEKFLNAEISRENIINILETNTGLLTVEKII